MPLLTHTTTEASLSNILAQDPAIQIDSLGKCYHIYNNPADRLLQSLWRGRKQLYREFWALRDVSFSIKKGESVGIIGRNGSGKSTLLQLIAGTLMPTIGEVKVNGRVAALLELGSGFNPDFTGRENVFMNGAILGLSQNEIEQRFADIAAFADIGDFLDQPAKTYSSGMLLRLAFAVSVCVEPDILIVDEALAVGDEIFQRKCFAKIKSIQQSGTTILFVSHSASTVVELCDRAILLDQGELLCAGSPKAIVTEYHKLIFAPPEKRASLKANLRLLNNKHSTTTPRIIPQQVRPSPADFFDPSLLPQSTVSYEIRGANIHSPLILGGNGSTPANILIADREYIFCYDVNFIRDAYSVRFGMLVKTISGLELGGYTSALPHEGIAFVQAGQTMRVKFTFKCTLLPGTYFLNAGCFGIENGEEHYLHRIVDVMMFRVNPVENDQRTGMIDFDCHAQAEILS